MSEQAKHTPGPWETGEEYGDDRPVSVYADGQEVLIADVFPDDAGVEARDANALLIAAAPALLAACRAALLTRACDTPTRDRLRAAITKATGT